MKRHRYRGFSLIELLVAIALMGIIMAIALPSLIQWRDSLQYRDAAKGLVSFIRNARSRAISTNRQQRVEINVANRTYRIRAGARAVNSGWGPLPDPQPEADVIMSSARASLMVIGRTNNADIYNLIICNPNGTMQFTDDLVNNDTKDTAVVITIFDNQTAPNASLISQRYRVDVTQTGRVTARAVSSSDPYPPPL